MFIDRILTTTNLTLAQDVQEHMLDVIGDMKEEEFDLVVERTNFHLSSLTKMTVEELKKFAVVGLLCGGLE